MDIRYGRRIIYAIKKTEMETQGKEYKLCRFSSKFVGDLLGHQ
jgi:hypothetical protein